MSQKSPKLLSSIILSDKASDHEIYHQKNGKLKKLQHPKDRPDVENEYKRMLRDGKIVWRNPDTLKPWPGNPRTHSDRQLAALMNAIKKFGFTNPVLIDELSTILCGHGRLQAAKRLNMAEVPVIILKGLTEAQKRAFVIADNKISDLGTWDKDLLIVQIQSIIAEGELDVEDIAFTTAGRFVLHWFGGSKRDVEQAVELGCWFSVGPAMLQSKTGLHVVRAIPLDRIIPETDGPLGVRKGRILYPWEATEIAYPLSEQIGVTPERLRKKFIENFRQLISY